jgi:beta-lactamase regulating signal transducer with metallopeptidase domain
MVQLTDLHSFFIYVFFGFLFIMPVTLIILYFFKINDPKQRMHFYLLALAAPITAFILYHTVLVKRCVAGVFPEGPGWRLFNVFCAAGNAAVRYLGPLLAVIVVIGLLKALSATLLVARMRRRAVTLGQEEQERVMRLAAKHASLQNMAVPELIFCRRRGFAAFTAGLLRPVIIMNADLPCKLSDCELEAVLTHELIHIRRSDTTKNWLLHLLCGAMFFSPFSSMLLKRYLLENECACDRETVRVTGRPREYAATLVKVWRLLLEEREFKASLAAGLTGQKLEMESRITSLLSGKQIEKLPVSIHVTLLVTMLASTVFFLGLIC